MRMVYYFGLIVFIELVACFTQMWQHTPRKGKGKKKKDLARRRSGFAELIELRVEIKNMIFSSNVRWENVSGFYFFYFCTSRRIEVKWELHCTALWPSECPQKTVHARFFLDSFLQPYQSAYRQASLSDKLPAVSASAADRY